MKDPEGTSTGKKRSGWAKGTTAEAVPYGVQPALLHPLHVGNNRETEGHGANSRRVSGSHIRHGEVGLRHEATRMSGFCLSDIGWIVGHSYVVYAPLLHGCTTIMYEGTPDYPEPDVIWRLVEKHRVTRMWMSPTLVRALMRHGDEWPNKHDLSTVELVVCAGEVLNPPAWRWLHSSVLKDRVPVIDHMWQTESSGPMVGYPYGIGMIPIKPGSAGIPLPGIEGDVVDEKGNSLPP
jgi:acyl-coenzyme A synthetase/AMP-(fatty) acid ligase